MCAVYDICDACGVDHWYEGTTCRFPMAARALFALGLPEEHPHVRPLLERLELEIVGMVAP